MKRCSYCKCHKDWLDFSTDENNRWKSRCNRCIERYGNKKRKPHREPFATNGETIVKIEGAIK